MIDTLKIQPRDFEISDSSRLTVQPAPYVAGTGETLREHILWTGKNGEIRGEKAYLNTERFQVDVRSKGGETLLFVTLSVPRYLNGSNFYSPDRGSVTAVLSELETELSEYGIRFNVQDSRLSRVDLFRNAQTSQPFLSYSPLFALMKATRQKKRDYGTSFLWFNTQQQWMIYDKREEMRAKGIDVSKFPPNIMRVEHRLLSSRKIKNTLQLERAGELVPFYDGLREYFRGALKDNLFRHEVKEIQYMTEDKVMSELTYFVDSYGAKGLSRYLTAKGAESVYRTVQPEVFRKVLEQVLSENMDNQESVRRKIGRAVKDMDSHITDLEMIGVDAESLKPISELYLELVDKLCA
jgi:hypothetical protein